MSNNTTSVFEDTDFEGMINALHIAMDEIDHAYNHEPDEQMRENYTISYTQLSKIETILINLQNGTLQL